MKVLRRKYLYCFTLLILMWLAGGCKNGVSNEQAKTIVENAKPEFSDSLLIEKEPTDTVNASEIGHSTPAHQSPSFQAFFNSFCSAMETEKISAINKFIHPKWGIYYIDRPGAIDVIDSAHSIQKFFTKVYMGSKRLKGLRCTLKAARIPEFTCDKEYTGCLTEEAVDYHRISNLKTALKEYGFNNNYPEAEQKYLKTFEAQVTRNIVNFDKAVGLSFMFVDGKWYLAVIDLAKYSCSA